MDTHVMDTAINRMSQFVLYCSINELDVIYNALKWRVNNGSNNAEDMTAEKDLMRSIEAIHPGIKS
jgi:hypothetical protein